MEGYALQNDSIRGQCLTQEDFRLMASTGPTQWYGVWEYEDMKTIRYGYLGSDGKWAIEPVYLHATAFVGKYAGVHLVSGGYRFIDRQGRFVNDEVYQHIFVSDSLESDGIAFGVTLESGQQRYLDEDLQPLETGTYANGAVYRQDHPIEGLPSNYTEIVYYEWPLVMANYYLDLNDKPSYLLNRETGEGWTLDDRYYSIQKFGGYYLADGRNGFIVSTSTAPCSPTPCSIAIPPPLTGSCICAAPLLLGDLRPVSGHYADITGQMALPRIPLRPAGS